MMRNILIGYDELYNPESSKKLIRLIRSFIYSKLDHEQKATEFITEVRRRLYILHEYNCLVAKVTSRYPRTREFDLLLIKYVQLEFEGLYGSSHLSRQLEITTEVRVSRLLQVMLYPAVCDNESLINARTDSVLKQAVLQLLEEVGSKYLVQNKLVHNIANKILKRNDGNPPLFETHKNLATSDYGTDDSDSDLDNDIFSKYLHKNYKSTCTDCVEVPLTTDGISSVPTVEFVDDDIYFVYLQKGEAKKRKIEDDDKSGPKKRTWSSTSNASVNVVEEDGNDQNSSIVICSDSEDEVNEVKEQNSNVVTFEILDDDDDENDDGDKPNYMVYLQKEVTTMRKNRTNTKHVIVCSDSEDEQIENTERDSSPVKTENVDFGDGTVYEIESKISIEEPTLLKNDANDEGSETFPQNDSSCVTPADSDLNNGAEESPNEESIELLGNNHVNICETEKFLVMADNSFQVDDNFLMFENLIENSAGNLLIDPSVICEQTTQDHHLHLSTQLNDETSKTPSTSVGEFSESDALGGPVLSARSDYLHDADTSQDCRINESLLEELLMDDSFLLEGRKEFEELESFLFNDSTEKQGFYSSNFALKDSDALPQPETFDADMNSLEALLNDSQLFNAADIRRTFNASFNHQNVQMDGR